MNKFLSAAFCIAYCTALCVFFMGLVVSQMITKENETSVLAALFAVGVVISTTIYFAVERAASKG